MGYGNGQTATSARYDDSANMTTAVQQRMPLIAELSGEMDRRLEALSKSVTELEKRLDPVMRPSMPAADGPGQPVEASTGVPFGNHLSSLNRRLDASLARVLDILARLEV